MTTIATTKQSAASRRISAMWKLSARRHIEAMKPITLHRERYLSYQEQAFVAACTAQEYQRGEVRRHIVQEAMISMGHARQERLSWCRWTAGIPG